MAVTHVHSGTNFRGVAMSPSSSRDEVVSARRRLLRGTFAVPAVIALHSGSALAASSSLQCVQQQAASPVFPGHTIAPDLYVRVQLYQLWQGIPNASNMLGWFLSGSAVEAVRLGSDDVANSLLRPGSWKKVDLLPGNLVSLSPRPLHSAPGTSDRLVLGPCWVALRVVPVRDSGWRVEIVGVVDGTSVGTAVTGSCWTSIAVL